MILEFVIPFLALSLLAGTWDGTAHRLFGVLLPRLWSLRPWVSLPFLYLRDPRKVRARLHSGRV